MNEWITWGLQGLICFVLYLFWRGLERNSDTLHEIQIDLAKNYVTKPSFHFRADAVDSEIVGIRQRVNDVDTQMQLVRQELTLNEGKTS